MRKTSIHMRIFRIFPAVSIRRIRYCQGADKHRYDCIFVHIEGMCRACYTQCISMITMLFTCLPTKYPPKCGKLAFKCGFSAFYPCNIIKFCTICNCVRNLQYKSITTVVLWLVTYRERLFNLNLHVDVRIRMH